MVSTPESKRLIPPLENGDRLSRFELENEPQPDAVLLIPGRQATIAADDYISSRLNQGWLSGAIAGFLAFAIPYRTTQPTANPRW